MISVMNANGIVICVSSKDAIDISVPNTSVVQPRRDNQPEWREETANQMR